MDFALAVITEQKLYIACLPTILPLKRRSSRGQSEPLPSNIPANRLIKNVTTTTTSSVPLEAITKSTAIDLPIQTFTLKHTVDSAFNHHSSVGIHSPAVHDESFIPWTRPAYIHIIVDMEALSPRSTNIPLQHKQPVAQKNLDRHAPPAAGPAKAAPSKIHAPPPPSIVKEPGEDGEEYSTGLFLGKGGFAVCYEGKLVRNGRVFALKVVRSEMTQKKMAEKVTSTCCNVNRNYR